MDSFRQKVKTAAATRDGEILFNSSHDHAAILTAAMFENASDQISIFCGFLDAKVYGTLDVITAARTFLSVNERKLRIVIEDTTGIDVIDHPFIKEFRDSDDVEYRTPTKDIESVPFHFLVMDDDSYRFEENKTKPVAIGSFGNSDNAKHLNNMFDYLWENSSPETFLVDKKDEAS